MKLNTKLLFISIAGLATIFVISLIGTLSYYGDVKEEQIKKMVGAAGQNFKVSMDAKKKIWQTNALQVANNPEVKMAIVENDHERANNILQELGTVFKQNTGFKNVQVHLIDKDLRSFYKSWAPEKYGEFLSHSKGYARVKETGKSFVSMEMSSKGLRLKGLFPILDGKKFIGIANFEGGLNSIKRTLKPYDIDFIYFMDASSLSLAKGMKNKPRIAAYILNQKDVDKPFYTYIQGEGIFDDILENEYLLDDQYLSFKGAFEGFGGTKAGLYLLGMKTKIAMENVNALKKLISTLFIFLYSVFFILILCLVLFIRSSVVAPINTVAKSMEQIALGKGDLTQRIKIKNKDEIGELVDWFNTFIANLQNMILSFSGASETILESSSLVNDLNATINTKLAKVSDSFKIVSASCAGTSENMVSVSGVIGESTANIDSVASATEEMTSSVDEIAQNTALAKRISDETLKFTKTISDEITELGKAANEIDQVTATITGISEQTNLLALNATIEAARAGEAGKGFAVVAGEIKTLAQQTAEATIEIRRKIEGVQGATNEAVGRVGQVVKSVEESSGLVNSIALAVEEQSAVTQEIAKNVANAALGMQEVNENVAESTAQLNRINEEIKTERDSIDDVAWSTLEADINSREMSHVARSLEELLCSFNTGEKKFNIGEIKISHLAWLTVLEGAVRGVKKVRPDEVTSHEECEFGQWYFGPGQMFNSYEKFQELGVWHEKIHTLAKDVVKLCHEGKKDQANALITEFNGVREKLFKLLDETYIH